MALVHVCNIADVMLILTISRHDDATQLYHVFTWVYGFVPFLQFCLFLRVKPERIKKARHSVYKSIHPNRNMIQLFYHFDSYFVQEQPKLTVMRDDFSHDFLLKSMELL